MAADTDLDRMINAETSFVMAMAKAQSSTGISAIDSKAFEFAKAACVVASCYSVSNDALDWLAHEGIWVRSRSFIHELLMDSECELTKRAVKGIMSLMEGGEPDILMDGEQPVVSRLIHICGEMGVEIDEVLAAARLLGKDWIDLEPDEFEPCVRRLNAIFGLPIKKGGLEDFTVLPDGIDIDWPSLQANSGFGKKSYRHATLRGAVEERKSLAMVEALLPHCDPDAINPAQSGDRLAISIAIEMERLDLVAALLPASKCLPIPGRIGPFTEAVFNQLPGDLAGCVAEQASRSLLGDRPASDEARRAVDMSKALALGAYGQLPELAQGVDWGHADRIAGTGGFLALVGVLANKDILEALISLAPGDDGARALAALRIVARIGISAHSIPLLLSAIPEQVRRSGANEALILAAAEGATTSVKALLPHADANCRWAMGFTPLMFAAAYGHEKCAMHLVLHGGDAPATNEEGKTAAEIARHCGHAGLAGEIEAAAHAVAERELLMSLVPEATKRKGPNRF